MTVLNVTVTGVGNRIDNFPSSVNFPEGTLVNVTNPCTGTTVTGIFTGQKVCTSCVFFSFSHCPYVPGIGCISRAMRGDYGSCAVLPVEDLI